MKNGFLLRVVAAVAAGVVFFSALPGIGFGASNTFMVEGYYSEGLFGESPEALPLDGLTHLIYAFAIPQADGSILPLAEPEALKTLVRRCHEKGIRVCIAVGGWSYQNVPLDGTFETLAASDAGRSRFAAEVSELIRDYDLDGVELDWEYPDPGDSAANYEKLVLGLRAVLKPEGKALTAAVNGAWSAVGAPAASGAVSENCLMAFDWISVMGYDMNSGNHSPYSFADTSVAYWLNRGVPAERIVLGIPLYARPSWKQYRDIVKENPQWAFADYAPTKPLESWYNGLGTIREKTRLALRNAGGVMLFDIHEDALGEYSAVKAIAETAAQWRALPEAEAVAQVFCVIGGQELSFDGASGAPFIDAQGRTQVPVRKLAESAGARVSYDDAAQTVTITQGIHTVQLRIGSEIIRVDGAVKPMDTRAVIREGRTYIPARFILEALGYTLEWHGGSHTLHGIAGSTQ